MSWARDQLYRRIEDASQEELTELAERVAQSPFRQKFHIQPKTGLLNDPNGFTYYKGEYHLYYQWFPLGPYHGMKYWYHLKSKDLVNWEDLGIGVEPDTLYDTHGVYSGSGVVKDDELYLFYTGNTRTKDWKRVLYQVVAKVGEDNKLTKIVPPFACGQPEGYTDHFRDPKVIVKDDVFYCIFGIQRATLEGKIIYYKSSNLIDWELKGEIKTDENLNLGYMWECPDYFESDGKGVLMISPQGLEPKGDKYKNIFQSGYFIGEPINFDTGEYNHGDFEEFDRGFEFYAPQTTEAPDGRRVQFGWFGLPDVPTPTEAYGWAHCLTMPRILEVKDGVMYQTPPVEFEKLRKDHQTFERDVDNETVKFSGDEHRTYELRVTFDNLDENCGVKFRVGAHDETVFYYDAQTQKLVFDRSKSSKLVADIHGKVRKCKFTEDTLTIHMFVDESSAEIFVNDGLEVFSARLFNDLDSNSIKFYSKGKCNIKADIWDI